MNTPTTLSCTQFSTKISVEMEHSDVTLNEMFSMFESLVTGLGYHSISFDNIILEKAERLRDEQESFKKVYDPETTLDHLISDMDTETFLKKYITK